MGKLLCNEYRLSVLQHERVTEREGSNGCTTL